MTRLLKSLSAWGKPEFPDVVKAEIEQVDAGELPLQQGLSASSYAMDDKFTVMVISYAGDEAFIRVKAGIFYAGVISGCNCADDPTPVDEHTEYCEVRIDIDKSTAEMTIVLLAEQPD